MHFTIGTANSKNLLLESTLKTSKETAPISIFDTPGMLSVLERKLLYLIASSEYSGEGLIIDAGSFMGSSLVSLAQGLRDNPDYESFNFEENKQPKPIHSYELGYLPKPLNGTEHVKNFGSIEYKFGDSFVPILKSSIASYQDIITLNIGDFTDCTWIGKPIEICFVDICKTPSLNKNVSTQFMPYLIPEKSSFINQDFFFDRLPWIKITMGYLSEYFEWGGKVFSSSIYRCVKPIPRDIASYDPFLSGSLDECILYHDKASAHDLEDAYKLRMEISKAYLICEKGKPKDALDYLLVAGQTYEATFQEKGARGKFNEFRYQRAVREITRKMNGSVAKLMIEL